MTNKTPYEVLGVSPNASDEEIKAAYRELVRKYHPDKFVDSNLSELAEEKMKEVNAAYEEIQNMRKNASSGNAYRGFGYQNTGAGNGYNPGATGGSNAFTEIRRLINAGNFIEAENRLKAMSTGERSAEWYFLLGCVLLKKGYFTDASRMFDTACNMDPGNAEYAEARNRLRNFGGFNAGRAYGNANASDSACDLCSTLICADCCCEAMGGDLIRCC